MILHGLAKEIELYLPSHQSLNDYQKGLTFYVGSLIQVFDLLEDLSKEKQLI